MLCCDDTNVLVSALLTNHSDAATVQIMERVFSGEIIPLYNRMIISEYMDVLCRKKFGFSVDLVYYLVSFIERYGIQVDPMPSDILLPDMKDLPFYEIVIEKQDDHAYLVTGNIKHFPKEPFIVTPRELVMILDQMNL